jgi:AraC-like DNA-binding protein
MDTYDPKGYGKDKNVTAVRFIETKPPHHLRGIVHRFLALKTDGVLAHDYKFHALPDACTYLVFDQNDPDQTGVTKLRSTSQELNLGRQFHYVNIRFLPGVWHHKQDDPIPSMITEPYTGDLPLIDVNQQLAGRTFVQQHSILANLVDQLIAQKHVVPNVVTQKIFQNLSDINSVSEMAQTSDLSPRQLQRTLKQTTGFAPHDFLKVLRLQQSLKGDTAGNYADQSHFIHSFRKATGYTPARYARKFDV